MPLRVLFFGRLKEKAGGSVRVAEIPDDVRDCRSLIDFLSAGDPELHSALTDPSVRVAIDSAIVERRAFVTGAREIAFMPPFSGG